MRNGFRPAAWALCLLLALTAGCRTTARAPRERPSEASSEASDIFVEMPSETPLERPGSAAEPMEALLDAPVEALLDDPAVDPLFSAPEALPATPGRAAPVVRAGHVVSVRVISRNRVEVDEESLRVSASGGVTLPLLGDVPLAGFTLSQAKTVLTALYGDYVRDPAVSIDFVVGDRQSELDSPWGFVTVLGCVRRPGQVGIPPTGRLTVTAAIQAVGGTDTGARTSSVQVSRSAPDEDEPRTLRINLNAVDRSNGPAGGLLLRNGDVIFVPEGLF